MLYLQDLCLADNTQYIECAECLSTTVTMILNASLMCVCVRLYQTRCEKIILGHFERPGSSAVTAQEWIWFYNKKSLLECNWTSLIACFLMSSHVCLLKPFSIVPSKAIWTDLVWIQTEDLVDFIWYLSNAAFRTFDLAFIFWSPHCEDVHSWKPFSWGKAGFILSLKWGLN